ncbi:MULTISPECIES: SDR family NAD(P)-dependent oxidoreductase [Clostridium]|uniref:SDR family NAD(P)-dependent oxidoreductase n=1 Tax=Clostridium TaxID=1485 RepID=UPI000CF68EAE|nr:MULTISPECIES: SDR family NAD(P)-dependent oxidoreductase [Clostridium]NFS27793.1 SDR family NAD(P)-dependent oxidoreductase [Clostridium botulinum]NFS53598.1 SDR family NAD(P)-dependent oxidoreductase [Clostridium botulinum]NFT16168.1 SDR family NAD(P)-dependent oxidoreductase [Clostridium botulinum]
MNYIIITGASRGLGKSLALKLGKANTKLYLLARDLKKLQDISIEVRNNGGEVETIEFDLSNNIDKIPNLINSIVKNIDVEQCESLVLINNAGLIKPIDFIGNLSVDDILYNFNTNCISAIVLINAFIKKTNKFKYLKKIINISSGVAYKPLSGWGLYSASKSAINIFIETLITESDENIKAVSVDPGVMDTDIQNYIRKVDKLKFPYVDDFKKYHENGVLVSSDLVANKISEVYIDGWYAKNIFEKIKDYE